MISLLRHPRLFIRLIQHPCLVALGWWEAHSSNGLTFDDNPWSPRSEAYDVGRDIRKRGRA